MVYLLIIHVYVTLCVVKIFSAPCGENVPGESVYKGLLPNVNNPACMEVTNHPACGTTSGITGITPSHFGFLEFLIIPFHKKTPPLVDFF